MLGELKLGMESQAKELREVKDQVTLQHSESAMSKITAHDARQIFSDNDIRCEDVVVHDGPGAGASGEDLFEWNPDRTEAQQTPSVLEWLRAAERIGGCLGRMKLLDARSDKLDCVLPNGRRLSGYTHISVKWTADGNSMPVAIELKKPDQWKDAECVRQARLELLAINRTMVDPALVVLTDLQTQWHFLYFDPDGHKLQHDQWRSGGMAQLRRIVEDARDAGLGETPPPVTATPGSRRVWATPGKGKFTGLSFHVLPRGRFWWRPRNQPPAAVDFKDMTVEDRLEADGLDFDSDSAGE